MKRTATFAAALVLLTAAPASAHPPKRAYVQKAVSEVLRGQDVLSPGLARMVARELKAASGRWDRLDARWQEAHAAPEPVVVPSYPDVETTTAPAGSVWDAVAACEGGGNWGLVTTGNGYYFVLQFSPSTWLAYGGTQAELDAGVAPSRDRLIQVAEGVLAGQGPGAWPNCFP